VSFDTVSKYNSLDLMTPICLIPISHFIVPLAIAQRPRWRRKGTKLHIYNDHTFIAKHLSG